MNHTYTLFHKYLFILTAIGSYYITLTKIILESEYFDANLPQKNFKDQQVMNRTGNTDDQINFSQCLHSDALRSCVSIPKNIATVLHIMYHMLKEANNW